MELFSILTYDYSEVNNIDMDVVEPDWMDLINLDTPIREAGIYELKFSLQFHINSTSEEFLYRFSLDNGANWSSTYEKRVKGRGNTEIIEVINVITLDTNQTINLACQVSKTADVECTIHKGLIICERKG